MINTYLVHYGVKGMKWGVRKDRKKIYKIVDSFDSSAEKYAKNKATISYEDVAESDGELELPHVREKATLMKEYTDNHKKNLPSGLEVSYDRFAIDWADDYKITPTWTYEGNLIKGPELDIDDDNLKHYGVPGMKWGVRKKKPKAKTMTTKDLRKKTDRLKLERDYNQLTKKQKARAKMIGAAALTAIATTAVATVVRHYTNQGLNNLDKVKIPQTIWDMPASEWAKAVNAGKW